MIKELRTLTGMTQTEFGNYLGIPMRTIQNWESGARPCPSYLLELIDFKIKKGGETGMTLDKQKNY